MNRELNRFTDLMITYHFKNILPQNHIIWLIILKNKKQKVTKEKLIYDTAPLIAVINFQQSNSFTILSHIHTEPPLPPSLLSPYIVVVHLGPLQKEREEEREREKTKEGEVLVVTTAPSSPLVCAVMSTHNAFFTFTVNSLMKYTCLCNTYSCTFVCQILECTCPNCKIG